MTTSSGASCIYIACQDALQEVVGFRRISQAQGIVRKAWVTPSSFRVWVWFCLYDFPLKQIALLWVVPGGFFGAIAGGFLAPAKRNGKAHAHSDHARPVCLLCVGVVYKPLIQFPVPGIRCFELNVLTFSLPMGGHKAITSILLILHFAYFPLLRLLHIDQEGVILPTKVEWSPIHRPWISFCEGAIGLAFKRSQDKWCLGKFLFWIGQQDLADHWALFSISFLCPLPHFPLGICYMRSSFGLQATTWKLIELVVDMPSPSLLVIEQKPFAGRAVEDRPTIKDSPLFLDIFIVQKLTGGSWNDQREVSWVSCCLRSTKGAWVLCKDPWHKLLKLQLTIATSICLCQKYIDGLIIPILI